MFLQKERQYKDKVYYKCVRSFDGCKSRLTMCSNSKIITCYDPSHSHFTDPVDSTVRVRGCLFHWGQAIHRRVVLQGLLSQYKDITSHVRRGIRRILGLPFLPEDFVVAIWENEIKPSLDPSVLLLCSYLEETWLGDNARYNKDVWSQYRSVLTGQDRTNNKLEGFHSGLKKFCGGTKLQFWKFLETLTSLLAMTHMSIIKSNQGEPSAATRKKYRQQNSRLHSIVLQFQCPYWRNGILIQPFFTLYIWFIMAKSKTFITYVQGTGAWKLVLGSKRVKP